MNKYRYREARRTITMTQISAWIFILIGAIQIILINEESTTSNPLWERIFMILNVIIVPIIFLRRLRKLSSEILVTSYEIFECRYSMKIVCPYFIWSGIMFSITQINDVGIIKVRAYTFQAILIGLGIGWYYLSKYWIKKEIAKRKEEHGFNRADNCDLLCERCDADTPHALMDVQPATEPNSPFAFEATYRCTYCDTYMKMP